MSAFSLSQLISDLPPAAVLARSPKVQAGLAALVVLASLPRFNSWLSRRKANNFVTDESWDWSKELVVVTGGCSGIGAKIVENLEARNIKIVVLDVSKPSKGFGKNTYFYQVDLSDAEAIATVAGRIRQDHGDPTVLINNAGVAYCTTLLSTPEANIKRVFDVNLVAPFLLTKQFLPAMVQRNHGHIVNVGSLASFVTTASNVDYSATKSGILSLHEGLKLELRHVYNAPAVRATIVHPSWVRTPMVSGFVQSNKLSGPVVTPDDIAAAITRQLFSGYGAQIVVPSSMGWVSLARGLPTWIQDRLNDDASLGLINAIKETS